MWPVEGSQSHDAPAGKHSPCPIFGLLACFIHFALIRYCPSLFLCVYLTHSYTVYLPTHVTIKQSDRKGNDVISELNSARLWKCKGNLNDAYLEIGK